MSRPQPPSFMNTLNRDEESSYGGQDSPGGSRKKQVRFTNIYEAKNLISMKDIRKEKMMEFQSLVEIKERSRQDNINRQQVYTSSTSQPHILYTAGTGQSYGNVPMPKTVTISSVPSG